jgi:hypothetical protein
MSPRFRNKFLTICVGVMTSLLLVGGAMAIDRIAPRGMLGWLIKTISLAVAIPVVLVGYESLCDWYYRRFITGANQRFFADMLRSKTSVQFDRGNDCQVNGTEARTPKLAPTIRRRGQAIPVVIGNTAGSGATTMRVKRWIGQ